MLRKLVRGRPNLLARMRFMLTPGCCVRSAAGRWPVRFAHCLHVICSRCVARLDIFKSAVLGLNVECPLCRQLSPRVCVYRSALQWHPPHVPADFGESP